MWTNGVSQNLNFFKFARTSKLNYGKTDLNLKKKRHLAGEV